MVGLAILRKIGPAAMATQPFVQQVTTSSATIACFDEVACRLRVKLSAMNGQGAWEQVEEEPRRSHTHQFDGLQPGQPYSYHAMQLGDDGTVEPRGWGMFRTAPDSDTTTLRFATLGDSGGMPWWFRGRPYAFDRCRDFLDSLHKRDQWQIAEQIAKQKVDFFQHLGDINYGRVQLGGFDEGFFRPFEKVLMTTALFTTFGNHDLHTWDVHEYFNIFELPANGVDEKERFYSYTWGPLRVTVLDALLATLQPEGPQLQWLDDLLANAAEPWQVVVLHLPTFSGGRSGDQPQVQAALWPILQRHGVDLVLSGDSHNYQRFQPLEGVIQLVIGTGGKSIRPLKKHPRLLKGIEEFGYLLVEIKGRTLSSQFMSKSGASLDRLVLQCGEGKEPAQIHAARRQRIELLPENP